MDSTANERAGDPASEVVWQGDCCIDSLSERLDEMLRIVAAGRPIELDVRDVARIDTAGLQLLVAFAIEARRRGIPFQWRGASDTVRQAVRLANLGGVLELASE